MTDFQQLFAQSTSLVYPSGIMEPVLQPLPQQAFFPGGRGTIVNTENLAGKSVMCLGQDWGTYDGFLTDVKKGGENIEKNPTWRNLRKLLREAGIEENDCFFTNTIMGLRKTNSASGRSPAFNHPEFISSCQSFFLTQLSLQKPRLILVLGLWVAKFLADTSKDLLAWKHVDNYKSLDVQGLQVTHATFSNGLSASLVVLVHPSFRPLNAKIRSYGETTGSKAEMWMIRDANK